MRLTFRLDEQGLVGSTDTGETRRLDAGAADALLNAWHQGSASLGSTAGTLAGLAEAMVCRPVEDQDSAQEQPGPPADVEAMALNPADLPSSPLAEVLLQRRSERQFARPSLDQVATLLIRAGQISDWRRLGGFTHTHRPHPSAGGRHPLRLYLVAHAVDGLAAGSYLFDPLRAELRSVEVDRAAEAIHAIAEQMALNQLPPVTIFLGAELERTLSRYPTGLSLVWRDAGALMATLHLVATDLGLASCLAGTCGLLFTDAEQVDVGALILGQRRC